MDNPTVAAVQPMVLTPDEQAVIYAIRDTRRTCKPGNIVLRVEESSITLWTCAEPRMLRRRPTR